MTPSDWHQAGHFFRFNTHEVFYRDEGSGKAVLCLHGFPTSSWDWHKLWPTLTNQYRVVAPDFIGFGFSDKPHPHRYSFAEQASMVEALLVHLGIEQVYVLAHDYGDTVAQELLARHSERLFEKERGLHLRSVCLLNGGLFPEATHPRLIQKLLKSPLGPLVARLMTEARFRRNFSAVFGPNTQPSDTEIADFWKLITYNNGLRAAPHLSKYQNERRHFRTRWVDALQKTEVPLRLINGPLDPVSGTATIARFRDLVPDADVKVLEGIGHYPQIEAPDQVLQAFLEML